MATIRFIYSALNRPVGFIIIAVCGLLFLLHIIDVLREATNEFLRLDVDGSLSELVEAAFLLTSFVALFWQGRRYEVSGLKILSIVPLYLAADNGLRIHESQTALGNAIGHHLSEAVYMSAIGILLLLATINAWFMTSNGWRMKVQAIIVSFLALGGAAVVLDGLIMLFLPDSRAAYISLATIEDGAELICIAIMCAVATYVPVGATENSPPV